MSIDVLLVSTPNKNIDYPALSLPVLTASLRHAGISVEQHDINMTLRDSLLTNEGLCGILDDSIPYYARIFSTSEEDAKRFLSIYEYFSHIRDEYGFNSVAEVKNRAQARDYKWIFDDDKIFRQFLALFKINRALHYLIDVAVTLSYRHHDDYLSNAVKRSLDEALKRISTISPTIVGVSILDIQRSYSIRLIKHIRSKFQGKIVIGGADPTRFAKKYIENCKDIDVVFYREAEESLLLYVESLASDSISLSSVPGIMYRDADGRVIVNRHKPVDISIPPSPDFRGLPLDLYLTPAMPVQASRGCYWQQCRFCIHWDTYCDFRLRKPERVLQDIKTLVQQHKTKYFHFTDDCLPIQMANEFRELLRLIRESNLQIRWLGYFRFETELDKKLLEEIYKAGGRVLEIGLESASERILKLMRKNISVEVAERIIEDASSLGLLVKVFMFHGFPGENLDDVQKTIDFAERYTYGKKIRPFLALRNRFELLRGSDIYDAVLAGTEEKITRFWKPSGLFGLRAEYELDSPEHRVQELIAGFVDKARVYMKDKKVYNTDDENVMLDLLVLEEGPLRSGWCCV